MTIIRHKAKIKHILFFGLITLLVGGGGALVIIEYSALADVRQEVRKSEEKIEEEKKSIDEFKSELFTMTDPIKLREAADGSELILEKEPTYISVL